MNYRTKQSAYTATQAENRQSLSVGQHASTKTGQPIEQSAPARAIPIGIYTQSSRRLSTHILTDEKDDAVLAELFNDLKKQFMGAGLLTLKRIPSTAAANPGQLVLVISSRLEDLMKGVNNE